MRNTVLPSTSPSFAVRASPERAWLVSLRCLCHRTPLQDTSHDSPLNLTPTAAPGQTPSAGPAPKPSRHCHDFHHPDQPPRSQRQFARDNGLPRSTLGYWLRHHRPADADLEPALVAFLDSPAGYRFLRRLVAALHLVFHLAGHAGLRPLSRFLELSQLDRFVASSFGAQQALAVRLQDLLIPYADEQKQRLATTMSPQKITACLDENFHGSQPCLVAVEPQSNFLLLEAYHPQRDGDTWTAALGRVVLSGPRQLARGYGRREPCCFCTCCIIRRSFRHAASLEAERWGTAGRVVGMARLAGKRASAPAIFSRLGLLPVHPLQSTWWAVKQAFWPSPLPSASPPSIHPGSRPPTAGHTHHPTVRKRSSAATPENTWFARPVWSASYGGRLVKQIPDWLAPCSARSRPDQANPAATHPAEKVPAPCVANGPFLRGVRHRKQG